MGRGAALAHASAGLVLVNDNLAALPEAVRLARRTLRIARQNLLWAAFYNFGSLPLAAFGFIPPWLAALGMSLSSVAVVLSSTRLLPRSVSEQSTAALQSRLTETTA
jgi:Cu2+-exporting ATPase